MPDLIKIIVSLPLSGRGDGVEPPTKFSKRGDFTGFLIFRGGLLEKRG